MQYDDDPPLLVSKLQRLDGAELDIGDVAPPKLEEQYVDHLEVGTYAVLTEGLGDVVNENGEDSAGEKMLR